jgi:hypothetical protein
LVSGFSACLKLKYDEALSTSAVNFDLRRYLTVDAARLMVGRGVHRAWVLGVGEVPVGVITCTAGTYTYTVHPKP